MNTKKPRSKGTGFFEPAKIGSRAGDFIRFQTVGTYMKSLRCTVNNRLDGANVGFPHFVGTSVGMTDLDSEMRALLTDITLSHACTSLSHWNGLCKSFLLNIASFILADAHLHCKPFYKKNRGNFQ